MTVSKLAAASMAGIGSVAGVSGGAYLLTRNSSKTEKPQNIKSKLESEGYTPLISNNATHGTHWTTSLGKYKVQYSSKNTWNDSQLKERCSELFNKEIISSDDYKEARKYCVVPRDISGRLSDSGFHPLSTEESQGDTKWTKLSEAYKKGGDGFKKLGDLEHNQVSEPSSSTLREKCKEALQKDHWDASYDSLLESSEIWCTEEGFNKLPPATAGNA